MITKLLVNAVLFSNAVQKTSRPLLFEVLNFLINSLVGFDTNTSASVNTNK